MVSVDVKHHVYTYLLKFRGNEIPGNEMLAARSAISRFVQMHVPVFDAFTDLLSARCYFQDHNILMWMLRCPPCNLGYHIGVGYVFEKLSTERHASIISR